MQYPAFRHRTISLPAQRDAQKVTLTPAGADILKKGCYKNNADTDGMPALKGMQSHSVGCVIYSVKVLVVVVVVLVVIVLVVIVLVEVLAVVVVIVIVD